MKIVQEVSRFGLHSVPSPLPALKHRREGHFPLPIRVYGYRIRAVWVTGGIAWTQWQTDTPSESPTPSPWPIHGVRRTYKPLAKWCVDAMVKE